MQNELNRRQFVLGTARATGVLAAGMGLPTITRAASADAWGDLVGRFVYEGKAPERRRLKVDKDVDCCGKFDIRDETLMVGEEGGLMNIFVYVRSREVVISDALAEAAPAKITLDNRDCIFKPHCMTIWHAKQEFYVVNSDPVAQNVAFAPLGDTPANMVIPVGGDATWKFGRTQRVPVPIACNYHPWESAHVLPLDHPYATITRPDGTFRLSQLPVGELEFQLWQERVGYMDTEGWPRGRMKITIKPGANDLGTIQLMPLLFTA